MATAVGPWHSPRDLLDYLGACQVRLLATYEAETGRRALRVADPHGIADPLTRWAIAYWEADLWAALRAHQAPTATYIPPALVIGRSRDGRPRLRYRRPSGAWAAFRWSEDAGQWRRQR